MSKIRLTALNSLLLVLASDPYDPEEYIRRYDEFLALRGRSARQEPLP